MSAQRSHASTARRKAASRHRSDDIHQVASKPEPAHLGNEAICQVALCAEHALIVGHGTKNLGRRSRRKLLALCLRTFLFELSFELSWAAQLDSFVVNLGRHRSPILTILP